MKCHLITPHAYILWSHLSQITPHVEFWQYIFDHSRGGICETWYVKDYVNLSDSLSQFASQSHPNQNIFLNRIQGVKHSMPSVRATRNIA